TSSTSSLSTVLVDGGVSTPLPAACAYTFSTPGRTTVPIPDDGVFSATPNLRAVHLSWVGDPQTTTVVTWTTDFQTTATSLTLEGQKMTGFSFAYLSDPQATLPTVRIHQVHLCGLSPGMTYHYQIGLFAGSFTTAPPGSGSTRFLVVGDARGNTNIWAQEFL